MLNLTSTSDKVQLITSAAASTDVYVSYVDWSGSVPTPGRQASAVTTAATTDIVPAPGASTTRVVKAIHIRNKDAAVSQSITLQHTDGITIVEEFEVILLAGERMSYVEGRGFVLFDANGAER